MINIIKNKYFLGLLMLLAWFIPIKAIFAASSSFFEASNALQYVNVAYTWGSMMVGGLALVVISYAGITYMRAFGNTEVIQRSKVLISGALIGLFLVFGGYFLLRIMDPRLVELKLTIPEAVLKGHAVDTDATRCELALSQSCTKPGDKKTCKQQYTQCNSAVTGKGLTGQDTTKSTSLQLICDTTTKTWKIEKHTICGIAAQNTDYCISSSTTALCDGCDDGSINSRWTNSACETGYNCNRLGIVAEKTSGFGVNLCVGEIVGSGCIYKCETFEVDSRQ